MDFPISPIFILPLIAIAAVFLVVSVAFKNHIKVPPDKVVVFTGWGKPVIVRGGGKFRIPGIHDVFPMSLAPFSVEAAAIKVLTRDNVPITVETVGMVKFGSTDEALATSTERFLTTSREELQAQLREILSSSLRGIISTMTVEELSQNREGFRSAVIAEAGESLATLGMVIDVFNIQNISDETGYLAALGEARIAQVKRDAAVGKADAERETRVKLAEATRIGDLAELEARTETARAQEIHDTEMAAIQSRIQAAQATAAQAGPIAEARARQDLVAAEAAVQARDAEAQLGVEQMRAQLEQARRQTNIVALAEAEAAAAAVMAQSDADASVVTAEGAARARQLAAAAEADAAIEAARGATESRKQVAQAALIEQRTTAEGNLALAMAEAEGKQALAAALANFGEAATRLDILPRLIAALPEIIAAAAAPLGNIDNLTVVDSGSGSGSSALERVVGNSPITVDRALKLATGLGLDIPRLLQGLTQSSDAPAVTVTPVADAPDSSPELVNSNHD